MNGWDDDYADAFGPQDEDEMRRAQEEDMWLEYERECAERDAAILDKYGPDDSAPERDEPSDADLFDRGMRVGTAGWAWGMR